MSRSLRQGGCFDFSSRKKPAAPPDGPRFPDLLCVLSGFFQRRAPGAPFLARSLLEKWGFSTQASRSSGAFSRPVLFPPCHQNLLAPPAICHSHTLTLRRIHPRIALHHRDPRSTTNRNRQTRQQSPPSSPRTPRRTYERRANQKNKTSRHHHRPTASTRKPPAPADGHGLCNLLIFFATFAVKVFWVANRYRPPSSASDKSP